MRIRFNDTSAWVLVWVICGRIYVFFSRQANKIRHHPRSVPVSLSPLSCYLPRTFTLSVRWNIKNSRERCAPESNVNGKRQRLRWVPGIGLGWRNGSWYHNFEMTGNLGQQQEQQRAATQDAAKWSASAKWENDASLLSTVTQNVPSQRKNANEIHARIYDAQFPKKKRKTEKKRSKKSNKFIL